MTMLEQKSNPIGPSAESAIAERHRMFWSSPQALAEYSADSWYQFLFFSEQLAFQRAFGTRDSEFVIRPESRFPISEFRILDLGCGAGRTTHFLHDWGADVIGVDISPELIRQAQRRAPEIDFRVGDAARLDFDDSMFDAVVFSYNGLDCLFPKERRLQAIAEISRVLRREGQFIFSHHNLAAFIFGGWNFLRPWPWIARFRLEHLLNGDAFHRERYFSNPKDSLGITYYNAWPSQVIADLRRFQFCLMTVFPNSPGLWRVQSLLRTDWFTRHMEPWPCYLFSRKPAADSRRFRQIV
jgi:SAM-dependent methyltransferase